MWKKKYLPLWLIILSACVSPVNHFDSLAAQQDAPLSQFIIGGWKGEDQIIKDDEIFLEQFGIEFVNSETLIFNAKTSQGEFYNEEYEYEIVGVDRILIRSKRINTEWRIYKDAEQLEILFPGKSTHIAFKRFPTTNWLMIAIILAGIEGGLLWIIMRSHRRENHKDTGVNSNNLAATKFGEVYQFSGSIILTLLAFGMGLLLVTLIILPPIYFLMREPWYSIIQIEMGIIITTLGISIAKNYLSIKGISNWKIKPVFFYIAVALIGFGLAEIAIGVLRLVIS